MSAKVLCVLGQYVKNKHVAYWTLIVELFYVECKTHSNTCYLIELTFPFHDGSYLLSNVCFVFLRLSE